MFNHTMTFDLGEDVNALRETVHRWAQDRVKPMAAQIDSDNAFPPELWPEMGELGLLYGETPYLRDHGSWQSRYMYDLGLIIGGGTAQIQKNIIAERGLGMPREPKPAVA